MAQLVVGVGSSHGPSIQTPPEQWARLADGDTRDPRFDYQALLGRAKPGLEGEIAPGKQRERYEAAHRALATLTDALRQARLDAVVVISNPHRERKEDNHPVFGVFRGPALPVTKRSDQPFDPDARFRQNRERREGGGLLEKPGQPELADHLIGSLVVEGFDIACADQLPEGVALDDAFTFPYQWLMDEAATPMVPFLLSRYLPNQATPKRCYELGAALRRRIEAWPIAARVGLIASGGLSHQVIDEELDQQVIEALVGNDASVLCSLSRERLNRAPGTPEILNWVTVAGAMAPSGMSLLDYLPAYRSLAGTGHGLTFGYWQ